jgi:hypothetical protein
VTGSEDELQLDLGKVCYAAEVWVYGKSCGVRLWRRLFIDVRTALRTGRNEIPIWVADLINYSYDDPQESGLFGPLILRYFRLVAGT